jgi:hypothetical protein
MFRALFAHLQEALHKRHLVCIRKLSTICTDSLQTFILRSILTELSGGSVSQIRRIGAGGLLLLNILVI